MGKSPSAEWGRGRQKIWKEADEEKAREYDSSRGKHSCLQKWGSKLFERFMNNRSKKGEYHINNGPSQSPVMNFPVKDEDDESGHQEYEEGNGSIKP